MRRERQQFQNEERVYRRVFGRVAAEIAINEEPTKSLVILPDCPKISLFN